MPQRTRGQARSSPTLQPHEQNMLKGACVFCEAVAALCVVPPPGKSNGIQRKNHTPPLPCTQAQGHHSYGRSTPSSTVAGMGAATAQLPGTLGTVGAPRRAAHECPHAALCSHPGLTRFWMSALLARSRSSITFFSALTASLSSSFCHCGITAVASVCKTGRGGGLKGQVTVAGGRARCTALINL